MTDAEMWSLLLGVLMPPFVALIMQPRWSSALRAIVSAFACGVIGFVQIFIDADQNLDALTGDGWLHAFLLVFVAAQAAYRGFWAHQPLTFAIENKTSGR